MKKFNEMSERERQINMKPLMAYETLQAEVAARNLPGFNKGDEHEKDSYGRFKRRGMQSRLLQARYQMGGDDNGS